MVYDINEDLATSQKKLKSWINELRNYLEDQVPILVIGNKHDLFKGSSEKIIQMKKFARQNNCSHFVTSAKTNFNIEDVFKKLIEAIHEEFM